MFFDAFEQANAERKIAILGIKNKIYYKEILVSGAVERKDTKQILKNFFGGIPIQLEPVLGSHKIKVKVSKTQIPSSTIEASNYLKFIKESKNNGLFIGLSLFGPEFVKVENLTHISIYGASGFGKTSFARLLLSQILSNQPKIINHFIDPKAIGFKAYETHPKTGIVAVEKDEILSLASLLIAEVKVRQFYFEKAFEVPPDNLKQYEELKTKYKRNDLPDFPRMMIWVDEAHLVCSMERIHGVESTEMLSYLVRISRAYGIHFVFITQRPIDLVGSIRSQIQHSFCFYLTDNQYHHIDLKVVPVNESMKAIPGRLYMEDKELGKTIEAQIAYVDISDSLGMGFSKVHNVAKSPHFGFYPIRVPRQYINDQLLGVSLFRGNSLENALQGKCVEGEPIRKGGHIFKYPSAYLPIEVENEDVEIKRELDEIKDSSLIEELKVKLRTREG